MKQPNKKSLRFLITYTLLMAVILAGFMVVLAVSNRFSGPPSVAMIILIGTVAASNLFLSFYAWKKLRNLQKPSEQKEPWDK